MVTVRPRKVPSPAAKRVQGFPVRPQRPVILRLTEEGTLLVEIQIHGKSKQVKAVADAFSGFCIELSDARVPFYFLDGHFKATRVSKPDKVRQKPRK